MMPPTSIDGTDITGATIDGTDVQEITVDGDTVFTAGAPIIEDFESGNVNGWSVISGAGGGISISNDSFNGSFAGNVEVTSGGNTCSAYFDSFGTRDFTKPFVLESLIKDNDDGAETNQGLGFMYDISDPVGLIFASIGDGGDPTFELYEDGSAQQGSANPSINRNEWYIIRLEHDGSNDYTATLFDTNNTQISQISATIGTQTNQSNAYVALTHFADANQQHSTNFDDIKLQI